VVTKYGRLDLEVAQVDVWTGDMVAIDSLLMSSDVWGSSETGLGAVNGAGTMAGLGVVDGAGATTVL